MNNTVETIQYKGYTIRIEPDPESESPREWNNVGTVIAWHSRYKLGDRNAPKFSGPHEFITWAKKQRAEVLPVYMYEHGGIRLSTGAFNDPWDSGQVGYIYALPETIKKNYGDASKASRELVRKMLQSEIGVYDQYLSGDVYGFIVEENGKYIDSCWGFYGTENAITDAKAAIDGHIEDAAKADKMMHL